MAQWSPHTSMASTPLPTPSPLESNRTWRKTRFRPNGHPRAPKSKSQSFDTDQGCAIRARSSVLSRTDVTFWKTKLQLKKKIEKKKIGNWKFCRPSNEIGSVQCDLKQNDKLLVWTDPIAPMTRPLAPPLNPPSLYRPPSGENKVWKTQKTAHSWRPVSSPPAKNDNEIRLEPIPATKLILLLWTNKTTK